MGAQQTVVGRRTVLAGTAVVAGATALGVGVGVAAPAEAATAAVLRKVVMYKVTRYRYNAATRVTTVLAYTKVTVIARFYGTKVYLKNSAGAWQQIPYVWSSSKKGLWYSRYLALQIAAAAAAAKLALDPTSGVKVITPKAFATAAATYRSNDWARHLLSRAGYGPNPADLASVKALGYAAWLEKHGRTLAAVRATQRKARPAERKVPKRKSASGAPVRAPAPQLSFFDL